MSKLYSRVEVGCLCMWLVQEFLKKCVCILADLMEDNVSFQELSVTIKTLSPNVN